MQSDFQVHSMVMWLSFIQVIPLPILLNSPHLFIPYQKQVQTAKLRTVTVQFLKFQSAKLLGRLAL